MSNRLKLTITRDALERASARLNPDPQFAGALWNELDTEAPKAKFNAANVAFYFGAMVIISAMTWFLTSAWDRTGGEFKTIVALSYAAVFAGASFLLSRRPESRVPSGLLATIAVCMTPLAVYGLEQSHGVWAEGNPGGYTGFYDYIKGSWIFMELATIVVGLAAVWRLRFPFLVAPIAFACWYASMDLAPLLIKGSNWYLSWDDRAIVSSIVGLAMILVAFAIDRFTREDYAFWMYLFGATSFWSGLCLRYDDTNDFVSCVIGIAFVLAAVVLGRRVLAVYGCFGCFGYIAHLAWIYKDSLSFPVALTLVGLAVIGLGIAYQALLPKLEAAAATMIPANIRALVPHSRV